MCDDEIHVGKVDLNAVTRRTLGAGAVAVTVASWAGAALAQAKVVEKAVSVKTADGVADGYFSYPEGKGPWPAVIVWPDIMGLRPVMRDIGKRLASAGYAVFVPNCYYRAGEQSKLSGNLDFNNPADRAKLTPLRGTLTEAAVATDSKAYAAWLDAQPQVDTKKKMGVQGYCMGGPLSFQTAHAVPGRIGAVGSFHGGGLVTDAATSPHKLIGVTKAHWLIAIAKNDDARQPEAKDVLKTAFAAAKQPAEIEVYPADHGWCVPGGGTYNEPAAEKAWARLLVLYKTALV